MGGDEGMRGPCACPALGTSSFQFRPFLIIDPLAQPVLDQLPQLAVHDDVGCTVGREFDDVQTACVNTVGDGYTKFLPVCYALEGAAVHLHDGAEVEAGGGAEELLEMFRIGGLWQEGEDAAAIVVDQDNGEIKMVQVRGEQAVEVVEEGEIADDQHDWLGSGGSRDLFEWR